MPGYHLVNEDPAGSQEGGRNESGSVPLRTPWIWNDDPNEPIEIDTIHEFAYGDAFLEPPYGITLPPRAAQDLFFAIDDVLLKRPGPETDIWHFTSEWDPDGGACWSPYFEWNWFGCCMWTVRTGPHQVIVIGASGNRLTLRSRNVTRVAGGTRSSRTIRTSVSSRLRAGSQRRRLAGTAFRPRATRWYPAA